MMGFLPTPETPNLFCSQLVALAYSEAGRDLLHGVNSARVSPADLIGSEFLNDVTDAVMRLVPHEPAVMQFEAGAIVDADREACGLRERDAVNEIAMHGPKWSSANLRRIRCWALSIILDCMRRLTLSVL